MSLHSPCFRHGAGSLLVVLQFALMLGLAVMATPRLLQGDWSAASLVLLAGSALLGGWTLIHNRLGNFNIHPAPKPSGHLVVTGPYRYMRHPMYSAVLLAAAALACLADPWPAWTAWIALVLVLWIKSSLEERWLGEHYPDYAVYRRHCKRFVPGLI